MFAIDGDDTAEGPVLFLPGRSGMVLGVLFVGEGAARGSGGRTEA